MKSQRRSRQACLFLRVSKNTLPLPELGVGGHCVSTLFVYCNLFHICCGSILFSGALGTVYACLLAACLEVCSLKCTLRIHSGPSVLTYSHKPDCGGGRKFNPPSEVLPPRHLQQIANCKMTVLPLSSFCSIQSSVISLVFTNSRHKFLLC